MADPQVAGGVLVTGSAGFIGSHLLGHLAAGGRRVTGVDRRDPAVADHGARVRQVVGDLRSIPLAPLLEGVSTVVHLAAIPGVRPSWREFDDYVECNLLVTRRLLEACHAAGVARLVIASSSSVYGEVAGLPMAESRTPAPASPYAVTKLAAEQLALAYARRPGSRLSTVALRFFTVYGPGQRPDMLIHRLITAALTGSEIAIYGDGGARRDFIYVDDVVRAVSRAMDAPVDSGTFNLGTGRNVSVGELISLVSTLAGSAPQVVHQDRKAGDVGFTLADVSRTADSLGFRATTDLAEGLRRSIEARRRQLAEIGA
ncbi:MULTISPECIES: NAD-dependent epimerase/dehydratase family protein [Actinoplanes]|uniref:NAD-dependent epimerase/dehydratase family protein n=1 Tax=Actinoplanes TaxID=1865 RepID=UPI001B80E364|nr:MULTISPECIES: NAD-dependent epimerase/dehydratase family protein [Actinoplanes]GLY08392.1 putative UDP-glucose epimerase YtcB [Actinoplanes sp. NBRC 101535]